MTPKKFKDFETEEEKRRKDKVKVKEKVILGLKFNEGILLATLARELFQTMEEEEMFDGRFTYMIDYEDWERLKRGKGKVVWEAEGKVPTSSAENEIQVYKVFDKYSDSRKEYVTRRLLISIATQLHDTQKELEKEIDDIISAQRTLYDTPPSTNRIAREIGELLAKKRRGERKSDFWFGYEEEKPISAAAILAGEDGELRVISSDGMVSKDSPYGVAGKRELTQKIYEELSNLYKEGLSLKEAKEIAKTCLKNYKGNIQLAVIGKNRAEYL